MTSLFRTFILTLLGLAFAAFGVVHAASAYPGPEVLGRFSQALPTVAAVLSFVLAVLAILVGVGLLIPGAIRMSRHGKDQQTPSAPPPPLANGRPRSSRHLPPRYDETGEWPDEYPEERIYADDPDGRYRRNGMGEDPRRAGVYR